MRVKDEKKINEEKNKDKKIKEEKMKGKKMKEEKMKGGKKNNSAVGSQISVSEEVIRKNLSNTLEATDYMAKLKAKQFYKGKVRDNYILDGNKRIIITTDRISCFDVVVGTIPFKGQLLNQMATFWFEKTAGIVKNHILDVPDPNVMVVRECRPLPIEMIVRHYITGSLWRAYSAGQREIYGIRFPENLRKDQRFDKPIITPSTKAEQGMHDEPITGKEIVEKGMLSEKMYAKLQEIALNLFNLGSRIARKHGLILVDTKYEFGLLDDEIVLIDEIHTPDSSRFWYADEYESRFRENKEQVLLDKEYVRQWLLGQGFSGNGTPPKLPEEVRVEAAKRYIGSFEIITGKKFNAYDEKISQRIERNLAKYFC